MAVTTTFLEPGTDATQDLTFIASTAGTVSSSSAQSHTGSRSLLLNTGSPAVAAKAYMPGGTLLNSGSQISCWIYCSTATPAGGNDVLVILDASGNFVWFLQVTAAGKFQNSPFGGTSATGTAVLVANTWTRISVSYYITNATTFQFKVYINGVLDTTANVGTLTNSVSDHAQLRNDTTTINALTYYDDIYMATGGASSGSQPDTVSIQVTAKRPFANGTTNGFGTQIGAGGSGYGSGHAPQVNEQPLSTTNGWSVINAGSAITEEYNIESASAGDVDISAKTIIDYMGWVYTKALTGETGSIIVNGVSSNISITTSNAVFTKAAGSTTYPAGTGADIGEVTSTTVTTVSLYECGILFAYGPLVVTFVNWEEPPRPDSVRSVLIPC